MYVDYVLVISHQPKKVILLEIGKYFVIKPGSLGTPQIYLGIMVSKVTMDNSVEAWTSSSSQYVKDAIENVERNLKEKGLSLKRRATSPISPNYRLEIDDTTKLSNNDASYYQSLIGILRWIVLLE